MSKLNRCCNMGIFLVATCILYAMNLIIAIPNKKFLSSSSIEQQTPKQLLCTYFMLQKEYEMVEFRVMRNTCNDIPYSKKF